MEMLSWVLITVAGIFAVVITLTGYFIYILTRPETLMKLKDRYFCYKKGFSEDRYVRKVKVSFLDWIDGTDSRLRKALKWKITGLQYGITLVLVSAGSFIFCLVKFDNLVAAVLFSSASILLLEQYLRSRERLYRSTMSSQMSMAVRLFTSEFSRTPQVERAISVVAANCPAPLGNVFKKAAKLFIARKPKDFVFSEMEKDMNFGYGLMFVELLRESQNSQTTVPLYHELEARITAREELEKENKEKVDGEVNLSLIMLMSPVPMYLFLRKAVPESYDFLTLTPLGRILVCSVFFSALLWAILARATERVDA